jgi:SNF2 family DNA or RNA helicase
VAFGLVVVKERHIMSPWYNDYYPKSKPRRPADGIKAQTTSGKFGKSWWASRWIAALERLVDSGRLSRGRSYARSGQVLNLDIRPGRVNSRVQGSSATPYRVQIEASEGIERRGVVLATLLKLKQVCNHPAQFLKDDSALHDRSGKLERLVEMLEEARSVKERVLIFTQFAEMGHMLKAHLQSAFGDEALFLYGGTPAKQREAMVRRFQEDPHGPFAFILSIKAGGVGLNLTRANHVFHFDRWWNPAVENQATDRAFRIGQTRNVQVYKYICAGTMEERIDEMIERKRALAEQIVGSSEAWITELSTEQLRDLFTLRQDAIGG